MLPGPGSYPRWKGLGFGTGGASGSRFLPKVEGFRVWDGRCFPLKVGELKKKKTGSYESRFLPLMEGFRVWDGRCFRVPVLAQGGRV